MATQNVISGPVLNGAVLETFAEALRGELLRPEDEGYEEARHVWNGMIDRHPSLIVRCVGVADVIAAVTFAREHDLAVSVRGGGHNVAGSAVCDRGMVIDLSWMRGVRVDPELRRVRAEGGALLGDVDHETQAFGLAVPMGVMSRTGVGGLTLHGGFGFLLRKYGLTIDSLLGADVVTADGALLTVDEDHHPELLWALKGGGGNFGVVTSFEYQAYPIGTQVWIALTLYPVSEARKVLASYRDFMTQVPDEVTAGAIFWNAPVEEFIPESYRGEPVIILAACYCGPIEKGEEVVQPLRDVTEPVADLSGPMPYLEAQQLFDHDYPDGARYYWKSAFLEGLGDEVIPVLIEAGGRRASAHSTLEVWSFDGAVSRVRPDETAFAHRQAPFWMITEANWDDPAQDEANISWARETVRAVQPFSPEGTYLNFAGFGEEGEALLRASFGANYDRLRTVKAKYDPDNFFRHNLNITPAAGE